MVIFINAILHNVKLVISNPNQLFYFKSAGVCNKNIKMKYMFTLLWDFNAQLTRVWVYDCRCGLKTEEQNGGNKRERKN